ncbi:DNA polymerase III subunit beta [Ureaplasma miroungigenitalium]|uniref:DNA polymerase III subunit beta n=1 Tax=Ureaplasma miroungigenitalium TaxID=1042321 RepID=A0ABT3BML7_9BACT|nr:DNA polymerase III subunit beta [Ureaplasma miroungigenitalium]MCV3728495.1 DNA polymerase III subunit beta [Ureaplasma miroungigenitalium]
MQLTVNTKKLIQGIKFNQTIANLNITNQFLTGVLIRLKNNRIEIKATNTQLSSFFYIDKEDFETDSEGFALLINAKILYGLINKVTEEKIILNLIDENTLIIKTKKFETQINTIDLQVFPIFDLDLNNCEEVCLPKDVFNEINNKILPAIPNLNGTEKMLTFAGVNINSTTKPNTLTILGTDKIRAAILNKPFDKGEYNFIISYQSMRIALDVLKNNINNTVEVKLFLKDKNIIFAFDNAYLITKAIEGEYPKITSLFEVDETKCDFKIGLSKQKILEAIERGMTIMTQEKKPKMSFDINGIYAQLKFQTYEIGNFNEEIEITNYSNNEVSIKINPVILTNVLKSFMNDEIILIKEVNKNIIVFIDENDPDFRQIISLIKE